MSKLARTALAAALAATALVVPTTADAATRAVVEIAYTKSTSGSGWDVTCAAQSLVAGGVAQMSSCYASGTGGIPLLCWNVRIVQLTGFSSWTSGLRCTDPTAAVADVGGVGVYRA